MTNHSEVVDPIPFEPNDGFQIEESANRKLNFLEIAFRFRGEIVGIKQALWVKHRPSPAEVGDKIRTRLLLEALCRFLNTGGSAADLRYHCEKFSAITRGAERHIGGFLLDSTINSEGVYEHVFAQENNPTAVRWVERQFVEYVQLDKILKEQENADARSADPSVGPGLLSQEDPKAPPENT